MGKKKGLILRSEIVYLRPWIDDDLPALLEYLTHEELVGRRYLPWGISDDLPLSKQQAAKALERWQKAEKSLQMAVVSIKSDHLIGHVDCEWEWDALHASVGVVIVPEHQRNGFGSAAARLAMEHVFSNLPANALNTWVADWNKEGQAFAASLGFQLCGRMRWSGLRQGKPYDYLVYDLLRTEWNAREVSHAAGR